MVIYYLIFLNLIQKHNKRKYIQMQPNSQKTQTLIPTLRWAQKNQKVFITIALRDIINQQIQLNPTSISFTGSSNNKLYKFSLELYNPISVSQSRTFKTGGCFLFELVKEKDRRNVKWPRLSKQNKRLAYVLIDWDRWDDQSQEEEEVKGGKLQSSGEQDNHEHKVKSGQENYLWNEDNNQDKPLQPTPQSQMYQDNDQGFENEQKLRNYDYEEDNDSYNGGRYNEDIGEDYDERYDRDEGRRDDYDD